MSNKLKLILVFVCTIAVLSLVTVISYFTSIVPSNPPGTVGNTAGNLNNLGLFCESDGKVYFANAYDRYHLYVMSPEEEDLKCITKAQVQYVNAGGDYLYYYQVNASTSLGLGNRLRVNGLYRTQKNGNKALCLSKNTIQTVNLVDDTVFYQTMLKGEENLHLFCIGTDKSDETDLSNQLINPACAQNGTIYFAGTEKNHYLYAMTKEGNITTVLDQNMWNPCILGDYVYYMDIENGYGLSRSSLSDGSKQILTNDRVDTFNVCDSFIYYQKNENEAHALMRMGLDGSYPELVAQGIYRNINITSQYVYFQDFGSDTPIYHTPTYGPINVTDFTAAKEAAFQENK